MNFSFSPYFRWMPSSGIILIRLQMNENLQRWPVQQISHVLSFSFFCCWLNPRQGREGATLSINVKYLVIHSRGFSGRNVREFNSNSPICYQYFLCSFASIQKRHKIALKKAEFHLLEKLSYLKILVKLPSCEKYLTLKIHTFLKYFTKQRQKIL